METLETNTIAREKKCSGSETFLANFSLAAQLRTQSVVDRLHLSEVADGSENHEQSALISWIKDQ